jgi:alkyl hydroperoxide reductase subunit AhpC
MIIGKPAENFTLPGYYQSQTMNYSLSDYRGRWVVVFFYTGDRTSVCSTEVTAFNGHVSELDILKVSVLGISVDKMVSHQGWADELKLNYPLLSDESGDVSRLYGVYDEQGKQDFRGTFIVDPEGNLRFMSVGEPKIGRGIFETMRVVQALQTGEACPVDWKLGQPTLGK